MSRLQPEDEAEYCCVTWHSDVSHSDTGRRQVGKTWSS
jgi:hypothetical protein